MEMVPNRDNKGIALIVTLTIITLLVTISLELNRQVRSAVTDSAAFRDRATLRHMIYSGVAMAETILARDKKDTEVDSVQEDWANPEKIDAYLSQLAFDKGELSIRISDELSRIQVNSLVQFPKGREFNENQQKLWYRFITLMLEQQEESEETFFNEQIEPPAIINPVKDWLDSEDDDAISGLTGAEDDYYRDLDPPYACRNGPIRHINELLRIKNISPELFYSTEDAMAGIAQFMTVYGMEKGNNGFTYPGKININTAEMPVIAGILPAGREFLAPEIVSYREEKEGDEYLHELSEPNWYKQVPGCSDLEIESDLITTQSDIFRIECMGELNGMTMAAQVIVKREKESESGRWVCRKLSWRFL